MNNRSYVSVFPGRTGIKSYTNTEQMRQNIAEHPVHDVDGWQAMHDYFDKVSPEFMPLMQMELSSRESFKQL